MGLTGQNLQILRYKRLLTEDSNPSSLFLFAFAYPVSLVVGEYIMILLYICIYIYCRVYFYLYFVI